MKVLKFGGSSVADAQAIKNTIDIITETHINHKQPIWVVVSALGGITDLLLLAGNQASNQDETYKTTLNQIETRHIDTIKTLVPIMLQSSILSQVKSHINELEALCEGVYLLKELSVKTQAIISCYGEILSSTIIAYSCNSKELNVEFIDSREFITTYNHTPDKLDFQSTRDKLKQRIENKNQKDISICGGFIALTQDGNAATLGRGGSDYTASIIASILNAEILEIWTDVSGMYSADPRIVKQAKPIEYLSYKEALELSHFGAKVIYPPTIQPVLEKDIPIIIKNSFAKEEKGTYISKHISKQPKNSISGVSSISNIATLLLEGSGMVGISGFSSRLFDTLSRSRINVILITQASSEHSICVAIESKDIIKAKEALDKHFAFEISQKQVNPVIVKEKLAIVAIVGDQMYKHQGISGKIFSTLGKNNVNIQAIAQGASERNISVVIKENDVKKALNCLHESFFELQTKLVNLFITGIGNVGSKLLEQISNQQDFLREKLGLAIRVVGIANSKKMYINAKGIDIENYQNLIQNEGKDAGLADFLDQATTLNLRNSIFVDNTASKHVSEMYQYYLSKSIAVVTCNKIACADQFDNYLNLKQLSRKYNTPFLYETNVGAGLPIIDTLANLVASGDQVLNIEAVLSGSLNFICNTYNGKNTFYDVVLQAKELGYTEPDPRIDLSGVDVARKILILARESGFKIELEDIENNTFLPQACLDAISIEGFLKAVQSNEQHFKTILENANNKNCRLKYVAKFEIIEGVCKASVGLKEIPQDHPFYQLEGSDNIVLFQTERYPIQPLIVKGAGAGADVTASGIFADIIRIAKQN